MDRSKRRIVGIAVLAIVSLVFLAIDSGLAVVVLLLGGGGTAAFLVFRTRKQWNTLSDKAKRDKIADASMTSVGDQVRGLLTGETTRRLAFCEERLEEFVELKQQHKQLQSEHRQLQHNHDQLQTAHDRLQREKRSLKQNYRQLEDHLDEVSGVLDRARDELSRSVEEKITDLFCTWCSSAGGHVGKVDQFRDVLQENFEGAQVRLLYRDSNSHELVFQDEPVGATYWFVTLDDVQILLPRPRNPQVFRELPPVYGGRLLPQDVEHVIPARVTRENDEFVLSRPGLVSSTPRDKRYIPPRARVAQ
jgi:FtsZ-binding cell division protein ZapB